ncbi:UPF0481 protein [Camellia lanceoleosa]|uniref:UPF0481 protein n=1 Tax=Camellia lanceoleosa TaxID=1840588 RepID=A0ACC0FZ59_9ERIC|nr:UPF0481 protein [Camellia lanceoleosa]
MENSSSNHEIKDNYGELKNSIGQLLTCLPPSSPLDENCICRVPRKLRQLNEAAYTPQMVSIGPLHHGEKHLKGMEEQKMRCLKSFLACETINLEDCVKMIKNWERRIRNCYAESIKLSSDEFVKMILLDSSFIIVAMVESDLEYFLGSDLLTFSAAIQNFFITNHKPDLKRITRSSDVRHFNDLLRIYHAPLSQRPVPTENYKYLRIQNAAALHKAGVKFEVGSSSECLLDIQFNKGVLKIPHLCITDNTEQLLRNIIALEWYLHGQNSYIIDYVGFMENLIDTPDDVEILEKNGILEHWLGDKSAVSNLFNNLTTHVPMQSDNYYFYGISEHLNSFCKVPWHNWKATLKRDYFSSPWRVASTVAAIVFLMLTFIQTICSIISL